MQMSRNVVYIALSKVTREPHHTSIRQNETRGFTLLIPVIYLPLLPLCLPNISRNQITNFVAPYSSAEVL
jgi:hypothetical protein